MGKAKTSKRGNASSGPYERPSKSNAAANNVFKFTKDLGQHILKNPGIAQAIVDKAYLKPTDVVLEVGPGTGNLTVQIVAQAKKVIAVEMDPRMAAEVTKRLQGKPEQKKLEVILGDVIKQEPLPDHDVCISNTPYQISSPLVFKLLRLPIRPPPQVDSSVVRIEPKMGSERPNISFEEFDGLLRIAFNRRNKVLRSLFLTNKEVLKLIETNYRLYCATHDIAIDEGLVDDAGEDEEMEVDDNDNDASMDVDGDEDMPSFFSAAKKPAEGASTSTRGSVRKTRLAVLVKEKVRKVLEETGLAESRSAKLHENDFLSLLAAFNAEGIHFS
ncbi:rRNA adenine dimethylase [Hypoxylon argillaceum]|nr:rRNA adenine dimethylase [Hypoxylon argillaceum]